MTAIELAAGLPRDDLLKKLSLKRADRLVFIAKQLEEAVARARQGDEPGDALKAMAEMVIRMDPEGNIPGRVERSATATIALSAGAERSSQSTISIPTPTAEGA